MKNRTIKRRALPIGVLINILIIAAILMSACATQPAAAPAPAAEPTQAPAAAEPDTADAAQPDEGLNCESVSGEATVWVMAFDPHVNGWNNVAEGFMAKYPNIKVNVEPQGGQNDMLAKYIASLSSKSGGDIFTTPGNMVYEWSMTDQILPLTPKLWDYAGCQEGALAGVYPAVTSWRPTLGFWYSLTRLATLA